jgi:hypothetical protein
MRTMFRPLLIAAAAISAACTTAGAKNRPAEPETSVEVQNQSFNDMTIYVVRSAQRIRLGTAGGNTTSVLKLPRGIIFGITQLQFVADPIGGQRLPISESISVTPGDQVRLIIPPR